MSGDPPETLDSTPERIILRSPNDTVCLKQLVLEDAETYFNLIEYDRAHLMQHGDRTSGKYPDVESVRRSIEQPEDPDKLRFGIWDGDVMVGSDNITPEEKGVAEFGSWVGKQYIGHGYAGRGRVLLLEYAFNVMGLREVHCDIRVGNEASKRSVEKSGFRFVGEVIDRYGNKNWRYVKRNPDSSTR